VQAWCHHGGMIDDLAVVLNQRALAWRRWSSICWRPASYKHRLGQPGCADARWWSSCLQG
ncbi:MAG: hypothetical protein ACRYHQ_10275, partial [Janthinobacterium lividum]